MSLTKKMCKNFGKDISENVGGNYSQKLLHQAKQSTTDAFKTASIRLIPKAAEATVDSIGNKIVDRI